MAECFQDFIFRVPVQDLVRHHFQELLVLNSAASVVINVRYHLLNLLLLRLKAERAHRNFKLLGIDGARPVGVEKIERLLDFLLLLLGAGIETAERHASKARTTTTGGGTRSNKDAR